jgi:hypothetical protein
MNEGRKERKEGKEGRKERKEGTKLAWARVSHMGAR